MTPDGSRARISPHRRWEISILLEDPAWRTAVPGAARMALRAARRALAAVGAPAGHLALLLADDARIEDLNGRFRARRRATNVLSFPGEIASGHLGDIVVARQTLVGEARRQGKQPAAHLAHLVVHAVLHLFGYDHRRKHEAERMEWKERRILQDLSLGDPYALTRRRGVPRRRAAA